MIILAKIGVGFMGAVLVGGAAFGLGWLLESRR